MGKHTKGWRHDTDGLGIIYNSDGVQIAALMPSPNRDTDARLIAAAPEMLEALKDAVQILKLQGAVGPMMDRFENALKKVDGESK